MQKFLMTAACAALLAACQPPSSQQERPDTPPGPQAVACNDVAPNANQQVAIEEAVASTAAVADLRGGRIAPGVYDLISATRLGDATGWQGTRAVALGVTEGEAGAVTFNWAGAAAGGETDRWTASFTEAPTPSISYTCGRVGEVSAEFAASDDALELRLPDGANGRLALSFRRRS